MKCGQPVGIYCFSLLLYVATAIFDKQFDPKNPDLCFCQLQGQIDDCQCNVDTVDYFNNIKIYPILQSLLQKNYFRFYKVNLKFQCPFWADDSRCAIRHCSVETCSDDDIPVGLKKYNENSHSVEPPTFKYLKSSQEEDCTSDVNSELGYLNTTISAASYEEFQLWKAYDDIQDNFCVYDDDSEDAEYVDLLLNPERYTGYKGKSAHRVWHSIYNENCFGPDPGYSPYILSSKLSGMCLEKRAFYRVISGLHSSINIHLCSNYLSADKGAFSNPNGVWGPNLEEFQHRFSPESTNSEGPVWLKNLYFLYLLELRALSKAANYLEKEEYYTGNDVEDQEVQTAVRTLLTVVRSFSHPFNERSMFAKGKQALRLKEQFRQHFRNITRIMDCVGCDKCKLWGKLQTRGIGTALNVLFSGKFDEDLYTGTNTRSNLKLERGEIVALINSFGRLSTSIFKLEEFRKLMR